MARRGDLGSRPAGLWKAHGGATCSSKCDGSERRGSRWQRGCSGCGVRRARRPRVRRFAGSGLPAARRPASRRCSIPGDARIPQFIALGGVVGVPLGLPALAVLGWVAGVALAAAVRGLVHRGRRHLGAPGTARRGGPDARALTAARGTGGDRRCDPRHDDAAPAADREPEQEACAAEVHAARALFRDRGWLDDPAAYHRVPPPLRR